MISLISLLLRPPVCTEHFKFHPRYKLNDCGVVLNPDIIFEMPSLKKGFAVKPVEVRAAQTVYGYWVFSESVMYSSGGWGSAVSVQDLLGKQYHSKEICLQHALASIIVKLLSSNYAQNDTSTSKIVNYCEKEFHRLEKITGQYL